MDLSIVVDKLRDRYEEGYYVMRVSDRGLRVVVDGEFDKIFPNKEKAIEYIEKK